MHPYLLRLGPPRLWVGSYGVCIALAAVTCWIVGPRWAERLEGFPRWVTRRSLMALGVAAFVGGRVHALWNAWDFVWARARDGAFDTLLYNGFHAGGAVVATILALPFVARRYGISPARFGDAIVPSVGLGIAIARLGCFLNGCCFGTRCAWPWCVALPKPSYIWHLHLVTGRLPQDALFSLPVHPLPLYFAAAGLLVMAIGLWLGPRKRYDGQVALLGVLAFGVTSAALEGLREDFTARAYWHGLPQLTWTAAGLAVAALLVLVAAEVGVRWRSRWTAVA